MTDANNAQTPNKEETPPATPPAPAIDEKGMEERITKAATSAAEAAAEKLAEEKLKKVFKDLSGEEEKPKLDPLLEKWIKEPAKVKAEIKEEAKAEIKAENNEQNRMAQVAAKIAKPFYDNTPQIAEHVDYVDALIVKHVQSGLPFEDACKKGFEEAVTKLKLPTLTEEEKNRNARRVGIPSVGSASLPAGQPEFDNQKSTTDFIKSQQARVKSFKERKV